MKTEDGKRFEKLMLGMADNFRDTITAEGMRMRWEILKPYTIEQVETAGLDIMRTRKYTKMPPVAEFIEAIDGETIPIEIQAERQWISVMDKIRSIGFYGDPDFDDPITKSLLCRRFNFKTLCQMTERDLSFLRKDFILAYRAEHAYPSGQMIGYDKPKEISDVTSRMLKAI